MNSSVTTPNRKQSQRCLRRMTVNDLVVSEDLTALYFRDTEQLPGTDAPIVNPEGVISSEDLGDAENLYRYDLTTDKLTFIAEVGNTGNEGGGPRFRQMDAIIIFASYRVGGVPGGEKSDVTQVYRYDSEEDVVQCMSCGSSFNPEPKLGADFLFGRPSLSDVVPNVTISSENGDVVFFETTAALVPQDIDGEIAPESKLSSYTEFVRSPSSDVYEWRKNGYRWLRSCAGMCEPDHWWQGWLSNELLGTTESRARCVLHHA